MKIFKMKKKKIRKQNVDLFNDWVVNKIIEKDAENFSTKCTRDNLDKSVEFIFGNSEEKNEAKIIRNEELCSSENHKLTAKTSLITERFNLEYKQRCYKVILC